MPAPTAVVTTPGCSCIKRWKLRPFKGSEFTKSLLTVPPNWRIRGIDRRDFRGDGDGLGLLAGLQGQIDANRLADLHEYAAAFQRLEALGLSPDRIGAGNHAVRRVLPGAIGHQGSRGAAGHVDHRHRGAGNDAAALVRHRPLNRALTGL